MRTDLSPRHPRAKWAVLAAVATLAVTFASAPARAQDPPAPAAPVMAEVEGPSLVTRGEAIESSKALTSTIAESSPELVARTDGAVVPVMIKLDYDPVATYAGGIKGLPATSPSTTDRALTSSTATTSAYARHIDRAEAEIVADMEAAVPALQVRTSFQVVYGGVSATVPANRVADLLDVPGVVAVQADEARQPLADWGTTQIGAPAVWDDLGGQASAGSGVLFASIDSGVWPEHPALADTGATPPAPLRPDNTPIACNFGDNPLTPETDVFACNDKLVGGRPFLDTYNRILGDTMFPTSARDSGGHGTHTATTAAGNSVEASVKGVDKGEVSGVAPGAWVVSYKVCGVRTCYDSDSAAAIQAAILDGVDVINFSITGGSNPATDPVELAFLDAYAAGVFVAASAGNTGSAAATVNHLGPWTTTVAATGPATTQHGERVASFSSRGPRGQIVKPDLAAPGVNVLAGITPIAGDIGDGTSYYGYLQGTSMAAPHVAGAALLLRAHYPTWTPGQIRSALMETATSGLTKEENGQLATPFDEGSGRISVERADDPGLVLDETAARLGTLGLDPLGAVHLNLASVYAPKLSGKLVTTRTFTNTGAAATYTAGTQAVAGSSITVAPATFTIPAGGTQTVTITIRTTHETGGMEHGAITLSAAGRADVRLPVAFDPEPGEVQITPTGCDPATIAALDSSTCSYTVDNLSFTDTSIDLEASGDAVARVTGADQGATTTGGVAAASGITLTGKKLGIPTTAAGASPGGFLPLSGFGVAPVAIADEALIPYNVPAFVFNGVTYTSLSIDSNGYLVVGPATSADNNCCNLSSIGNPARPNNILAPYWTDLDGTGMPGVRIAVIAGGGEKWTVVEWDVKVYGTSNRRTFQVWIGNNGTQDITFAYDPAALPGAPSSDGLLVGAENADGAGTGLAKDTPITGDLRVTSTALTPGASLVWNVGVDGSGPGTAAIQAEVSSPSLPGAGSDFATNALTVEAQPLPEITTDPQDQTVTALQTASFTAAATGGTIARWETSTNGGGTWATVAGASTDTLSFTAHAIQTGSQFRAVYANSTDHETPTAAATLQVDPVGTTTGLTLDPAAPVRGQAITLQATVSPSAAGGQVQFAVDGSGTGSPVDVVGGTASSVPITGLSAGAHTFTATFVATGSGDFAGSDDSLDADVLKLGSDTSVVSIEPDPIIVGDDVTVTVDVDPVPTGGNVQLELDGTDAGAAAAIDAATGEATITLTDLAPGSYQLTAVFSGDEDLKSSTSAAVTVTVDQIETTTALTVLPASPSIGDPVSFQAAVTPATATGTVQFELDGDDFGSPVAVSSGSATSSPISSLLAGGHTVTATYAGDTDHAGSDDEAGFTVAKLESATSVLAVSPNPIIVGDDVQVTVDVDPIPSGGTVQLEIDGDDAGAATALDPLTGEASITLTGIAPGEHDLLAEFSGDDELLGSTGDHETITVLGGDDAFVRRAYPLTLGRAADASGAAFWIGRLGRGFDRATFIKELTLSAEGRRHTVRTAYLQVLGRAADPSGLSFWTNRLAAGSAAEQLVTELLASNESYARSGSTPAGFAQRLYTVLLGRTGSSGEITYWANRVAAANKVAGRRSLATTFGRASEATDYAVNQASSLACGPDHVVTSSDRTTLAAMWVTRGHHAQRLAGTALRISCPPAEYR